MAFEPRSYRVRLLLVGALGALVAFSAYRYGMDMERKLRASEFERLMDLGAASFATDHPDDAMDAIRDYYARPR